MKPSDFRIYLSAATFVALMLWYQQRVYKNLKDPPQLIGPEALKSFPYLADYVSKKQKEKEAKANDEPNSKPNARN